MQVSKVALSARVVSSAPTLLLLRLTATWDTSPHQDQLTVSFVLMEWSVRQVRLCFRFRSYELGGYFGGLEVQINLIKLMVQTITNKSKWQLLVYFSLLWHLLLCLSNPDPPVSTDKYLLCGTGEYINSNTCTKCSAGHYCPSPVTGQLPCPSGTYQTNQGKIIYHSSTRLTKVRFFITGLPY